MRPILALLVLFAFPAFAQTGPALTIQEIQNGVKPILPEVFHCHAQSGVKGLLKIKMHIGGDGAVTSAVAQGGFAGTAMGKCAEAAFKKARFRASGKAISVSYPVQLR